MKLNILLAMTIVMLCTFSTIAQSAKTDTIKPAPKKHWYESISMRGYVQARYNRLLETNPSFTNEASDKSIGNNNGVFIRRARLIFFGQINERVYFYVQPDLASSAGTTQGVAQLRDAYFDIAIDKKREYRFRIGQSKIPFGFENMQSSQNRLSIDRSESLNSAQPGERDMGVFFYYTPTAVADLFSELVSSGLKGSGNYGCLSFGLYNGQGLNRLEANNNLHMIARATYPFRIKDQILEIGVQGYKGKTTLTSLTKDVKANSDLTYNDERIAGTVALYSKPFGLLAEYNVGNGPKYDVTKDSIVTSKLSGGYALLYYMQKYQQHTFIPYFKAGHFEGGKKAEVDARATNITEIEFGVEWQPSKYFELTVAYMIGDRKYSDFAKKDNPQKGQLLRLQAQVNF